MLPQDKCNMSTNDNRVRAWLTKDQQPLKRKGNSRGVHISDWICEPSGRLALSPEQVAVQMLLPEAEQLQVLMHARSSSLVKGTMHGGIWIS